MGEFIQFIMDNNVSYLTQKILPILFMIILICCTKRCLLIFFLWAFPNADEPDIFWNHLWFINLVFSIVPDKVFCSWKVLIFFLFLYQTICCGYSLEVPQQGASNDYPQHIFSCRNKKNITWTSPFISSYIPVLIIYHDCCTVWMIASGDKSVSSSVPVLPYLP